MDLWQAIILGLVEGITEYLPVSSTGHLVVTQRLLGIAESEAANAYAIAIQAGAIAAVLGLYRARIAQILRGSAGRDEDGRRILLALLVAFLPAGVLGFAFGDIIERHLFGPWPIIAAWTVGGIVILALGSRLTQRSGMRLEAIGPRVALAIGIAQCVALWPGMSRSLATILGALGAGLSMAAAVEFSFLLGLVTLGAATVYKAMDSGEVILQAYGLAPVLAGFVTAWLSAAIAVRWMVSWLKLRGLAVFGWWRLAIAAATAALVLHGW